MLDGRVLGAAVPDVDVLPIRGIHTLLAKAEHLEVVERDVVKIVHHKDVVVRPNLVVTTGERSGCGERVISIQKRSAPRAATHARVIPSLVHADVDGASARSTPSPVPRPSRVGRRAAVPEVPGISAPKDELIASSGIVRRATSGTVGHS